MKSIHNWDLYQALKRNASKKIDKDFHKEYKIYPKRYSCGWKYILKKLLISSKKNKKA